MYILTCCVLFLLYIEDIESCKYKILTLALLTHLVLTFVVLLCPLVSKTKNINNILIFINVFYKLQWNSVNNKIKISNYFLIINSPLHICQSCCISFVQNQFLNMSKLTHLVHLFILFVLSSPCFYCSMSDTLSEPITQGLIDLYARWYWFYQKLFCTFITFKSAIGLWNVFNLYYTRITCISNLIRFKLNRKINCTYLKFNVYLIPVDKSHCTVQCIESRLFVLQVLLFQLSFFSSSCFHYGFEVDVHDFCLQVLIEYMYV